MNFKPKIIAKFAFKETADAFVAFCYRVYKINIDVKPGNLAQSWDVWTPGGVHLKFVTLLLEAFTEGFSAGTKHLTKPS